MRFNKVIAARRSELGMQIEPTEQERQLLSILREWVEKDHYRLVIEFNDGAWEIEISAPSHGHEATRGVGSSFATAWDEMAPAWV